MTYKKPYPTRKHHKGTKRSRRAMFMAALIMRHERRSHRKAFR